MADSTTLDIRQITGRWVLEGASQVGRLTFFVFDMIRGLGEVRIWWPRMIDRGVEHRRRQPVHRAAHLRLRRRGHGPPDRLSVHRQHPLLRRRHAGRLLHHPRAGPGAHGAHPGRPHRGALRGGAGHDARHRADRRAREPGPLAGLAPGDPAGARRAAHDSGAHHPRQPLGHRSPDGSRSRRYCRSPTPISSTGRSTTGGRGTPSTRSSRRSSSPAPSPIISCYMGFNTQQGAEGVGKSPPPPPW